jgi:Flp pilus assembly protein TadG
MDRIAARRQLELGVSDVDSGLPKRTVLRRMIHFLRNLWRKRGGTALVEFAFAVPAMLVMFFGVFEVSQALIVYMKVIDVADTVSDLVAQQRQVASSDIDNYYIAGQLVMTPSAGSGLGLAVASVTFDPNTGKPSVAWQVTEGGAATMSDAAAAATGLGSPGDSVIEAQATYTYTSLLKHLLPQGITMSSRVFSRPRVVFAIPCTAPCS